MSGKEQPENRLFVGGLSWDVTERELEDAFSRFGKIIDAQAGKPWIVLAGGERTYECTDLKSDKKYRQIVLDRETLRPRGFGFLTFADRRDMEVAIREMDGREFGDRPITVNKAQPRFGSGEEPGHGYGGGGGYPSGGGRGGSYGGGGGDRSMSENDCFKCGRAGHWARDCPSSGGGGGRGRGDFAPHSRFGGSRGRGDRHFGGDRDRYVDDRYDGGRYGDRDRYESRDRYGARDHYVPDRYPPSGDRFSGGDRYGGGADRYPQNGFGKDRGYGRDGGAPRATVGVTDRYGGGGGPSRYEAKTYRDRPAPYDRPSRGGGRPSTFDDRY